ncbi:MAG: ATP-binding protein, partial [Peptococcaceae bacterium]|nr:ATP-binding protein [Peptococcaceae bacterium]
HDLLRRDQIFFTEKDLDTYISTMHSLSDFGSVSVRNDQSFMRNYFKGRYGRLPYIDFETVLALDLED